MPPGVAAAPGASSAARRRLGGSGPRVFPLAIGGNALGSTTTDDTALAVLDEYVAGGGDFVVTAAAFAGGRSEAIIGDWMRSREIGRAHV